MSDTLQKPVKAATGKKLTPEQIAWNLRIFSRLGWQSKKPAQEQLQANMKAACVLIDKSVLQPDTGPNCASALAGEKLKAGKEFKAFQVALTYYEKATPDARVGLSDQLKTTADAYIAHWEKHSKREKAQSETKRKKQVCDDALADLRKIALTKDVRGLGDPPWNSELSMKAASLKATLDFETLPGAKAEVVGGVHAFPAFWVNGGGVPPTGGQPQPKKSFLFKPMAKQSPVPGFPPGGDTAREAMTGRMGDLLAGMTGVNFGVPETHVVSVGRDKLPAGSIDPQKVAGAKDPTAPLVGSLQQFAKSDGGAREQPIASLATVAPEACQKVMILDMMTLNMDRHADNIMVQPDQNGGTPGLVPIDHGLTFPTKECLRELPKKIGTSFNAMLAMPGAHEPFTPAMLKAIDDIDPDTMATGMRREAALIEKVHPSAKGKLSPEAIEISRRSTRFLKLGAAFAPALSPASLQVALGQFGAELLDPAVSEQAFEMRAGQIFVDLAGEQGAIKELFLMPLIQQAEVGNAVQNNGWSDSFKVDSWICKNPKLALKVYKGDVKEPTKLAELVKLIGQDVIDDKLKTMTFAQLYTKRESFRLFPPSKSITQKVIADAQSWIDTFPDAMISTASDPEAVLARARAWAELAALGGLAALPAAAKTLRASPADVAEATKLPNKLKMMLEMAAGMAVASQALDQRTDLDANAVRLGIRVLDKITAEVPANHGVLAKAVQFKKAPVTGTQTQQNTLRALQTEALDAVRADVAPRYAVVVSRIEALLDDLDDDDERDTAERRLETIGGQRAGVLGGVVEGAQAAVALWESRYPA